MRKSDARFGIELDEWFERNQDATEFDGLDEFDDGEEM